MIDSQYAKSMMVCKPKDPVMMFFLKNGHTNNNGKFFSFERDFIGKIIQR